MRYVAMLNVIVPLKTDRGIVMGHGTVRMPVLSASGSIRKVLVLRYFVTKRKQDDDDLGEWDGGKYVATCINLKMDGYGIAPDRAISDMKDNIRDYLALLLHHFKGSLPSLENAIKPDSTDQRSTALWGIYDSVARQVVPVIRMNKVTVSLTKKIQRRQRFQTERLVKKA